MPKKHKLNFLRPKVACLVLAPILCWWTQAASCCSAESWDSFREPGKVTWTPCMVPNSNVNQNGIPWISDLKRAGLGSAPPPSDTAHGPVPGGRRWRAEVKKQPIEADVFCRQAPKSWSLYMHESSFHFFLAQVPSREQMVHYSALTGG